MLVVMAHRMLLGLGVAQLINRLHLTGNTRPGPTELATHFGVALESRVFQGRHTGQEQFQRIHITAVRNVLVAVVLSKGIENGVQLFLFFSLVLPVGVHGQTERIFPLGPIGNLDTFKVLVRENVLLLLIGWFPGHVPGQVLVLVLEIQLLVFNSHDKSPN